MKGLLIGVAGFHREGFGKDNVVHTLQTASRHFDHHMHFLKLANVLLVESRMDGVLGTSILLQNGMARPAAQPGQAVHAPGMPLMPLSPPARNPEMSGMED